MELFRLPHTAKVNRVIPKNSFDAYTNSKQKRQFTDIIAKITWSYKLSPDTINLEAKELKEIQIFKIELKQKEEVNSLLKIIDKAIPYTIIFIVVYENGFYLSTSPKHTHPVKQNISVIDWTFTTPWLLPDTADYSLNLKKSLDAVYHDFCIQLSAKQDMAKRSIEDLIAYSIKKNSLEKEILQIETNIKNSRQYKNKVELNLLLKQKIKELKKLL